MGNHVACVDVDTDKLASLERGEIPIFEPGLEPMVRSSYASDGLAFTSETESAIAHSEVVFIAVGTPPDGDGSADLRYALAVAETIGAHITGYTMVVNKSTVPVGTTDRVRAAIAEVMQK